MDQVVALPEYRAGILAISHCHVARFAEFLPSEHRIAARNDHEGFTEFLVEGRTLPVVPAGATPGEVILILTLEPNLSRQRITLRGNWDFARDQSWDVADWTMAEYMDHVGLPPIRRA